MTTDIQSIDVNTLLPGHVTIKRSFITNNGRYGVASRFGSTVQIEDSTISGNGYYGLLAESWAGYSNDNVQDNSETAFQDPRSILKATRVNVFGNGEDKDGGGYGVLNRGGEITLIDSKFFDNTGGNYRNEAGRLPQDGKEFIDFFGDPGYDDDACLRHDGTITVDGQLIGDPPNLLADQGECVKWP